MYVYKKKIYILLFSVLDALGSIIFFPGRICKRKMPASFSRILLMRGDHIGDVIASTVVLGPLRKAFPASTIDLLAPSWAEGMLEADPHLDNVVPFDPPWFKRGKTGLMAHLKGIRDMAGIIKRGKYDLAIDLRGDARHIAAMFTAGIKNRISYGITGGGFLLTTRVPYVKKMRETERNLALLEPLGIKCPAPAVRLYFTDKDRKTAKEVERASGLDKKYAVVHAFPGHVSKDWDAGSFSAVVRYLRDEKDLVPVMVGSVSDEEKVKKIIEIAGEGVKDLSGKTRLGVLGSILDRATLFVGVDSGPSHISASAGTPTVILFSGVNDPEQWAPAGDNVKVIYPGRGKDLSSITPEEVCGVIDEVLNL